MAFSGEVVDIVKREGGFTEFNPVQLAVLEAGLLEGKNMVVAAPTASGKTVVAELAALNTVKNGKKVVYIVPLRALASEKFREFKEKYSKYGIRIGMSIGDLDQSDPWLASFDIIIVTSEKLDSLLRHGISWVNEIGLVIADEIHLLDSTGRGPTLEVVLTRLRHISNPTILGLSATISNYEELAGWLNAVPVQSNYRPVELHMGVCFDNKVNFFPKGEIELDPNEDSVIAMVEQAIEKKKQALIFISTRRNAESAAGKIGDHVRKALSAQEREDLESVSDSILKSIERPTAQCEKLSEMIKDGVAFHHAGLTNKQREIVEDAFKEGKIKVITATPTLAAGINLPAWRVIIRDLRRFTSFRGMDLLPVLEIHQMAGRAGRPKYDTEGEAILVAKSEADAKMVWEKYIQGEPENIYSKLGIEPVLRTHVLALIASGTTPTKQKLIEFLSKTFYAHQYSDMAGIEVIIDKVLRMLAEYGFIEPLARKPAETGPFVSASSMMEEGSSELKPTRVGRRASELYLDPITAHDMIKSMQLSEERGTNDFGILHMISGTMEMSPALRLKKDDMESINELLVTYDPFLSKRPPNPWEIDYEDYLRSVKTAWFFKEWVEESGEDVLMEKFGVTPGELHVRMSNADWLLYSAYELALLMGLKVTMKELKEARVRVKYGIKKELFPLVKLKGIGRVRARTLYGSGLKDLESLRSVPLESLERIIGPKTARQIKEQLIT